MRSLSCLCVRTLSSLSVDHGSTLFKGASRSQRITDCYPLTYTGTEEDPSGTSALGKERRAITLLPGIESTGSQYRGESWTIPLPKGKQASPAVSKGKERASPDSFSSLRLRKDKSQVLPD